MISEKEVCPKIRFRDVTFISDAMIQVKIKELMFIMGFRPKLFWLGWLLSALIFALPMTLLTIIVGAFTFWRTVSAVFYVFTVIGFVLAGITFCFMMYSLFNKAIYGVYFARHCCASLCNSRATGAMFTLVFCFTSPVINIAVLTTLSPTTQGGMCPPSHPCRGFTAI